MLDGEILQILAMEGLKEFGFLEFKSLFDFL